MLTAIGSTAALVGVEIGVEVRHIVSVLAALTFDQEELLSCLDLTVSNLEVLAGCAGDKLGSGA